MFYLTDELVTFTSKSLISSLSDVDAPRTLHCVRLEGGDPGHLHFPRAALHSLPTAQSPEERPAGERAQGVLISIRESHLLVYNRNK